MTDRDEPNPVDILRRLGMGSRREKTTRANRLPPPLSAGVYVDVENLNNAEHARAAIETVMRDWPESLPPVRRLRLYTPADRSGLWNAWAPMRFPDIQVGVRGIQRFARESKNAADMAIVADAVADFTTGVVNHIAVVSNDSDFGALFVKLQELATRSGQEPPPFLWINLPGGGRLSREIRDFVPERLRWEVPASATNCIQPIDLTTLLIRLSSADTGFPTDFLLVLPGGSRRVIRTLRKDVSGAGFPRPPQPFLGSRCRWALGSKL